jgi:ABC-type multidrug transport system fused ATPase/permease subunit
MNLFAGLSPAVVISFLGYLFLLILRAGAVSGTIGSLQGARAKLERLDEFLALSECTSQYVRANGHGSIDCLSVNGLAVQVDGNTIFEDFDLEMNRGDVVLVKGPSGCGKSTLLRSLVGLQESSAGIIEINGRHVDHLGGTEGCGVYLPQEIRIFEGSLLWNIELLSGRHADTSIVDRLLQQYRLQNRLQVFDGPSSDLQEAGANLSGGEKQRLALMIVELMGRPVVLLDEPTSQVDSASEKIILEAVSNLARQGCMIIMAAHREATEDIAHRVIDFTEYSRVCGDRLQECVSPA